MINNADLVTIVRRLNREAPWEAQASINEAANSRNVSDFCTVHTSGECLDCGSERAWYDDDADEIVLEILS